jgi:lysozyme
MSVMRGIDINPFKSDLDLNLIQFDFMITKATGGNGYVNPDCDNKVQQAIQLGKKWGVFHYFGDGFNDNNPLQEADFFVDNILGYIGHGTLWLDWERGGNPNADRVDMAEAWLDHVFGRTGVRPGIYMSMALYLALDWSPVIAKGYALWIAAWPQNNNIVANYGIDLNLDPNPKWDGQVGDVLWQFTSTGRLDGYGGNLDCDIFYGNEATWDAYARPVGQPAPETTTTTEAPAPDPTTTTTTTEAPIPPEPDPTTTTTSTEAPQPDTSTTTSTTTQGTVTPSQGWLAVIVAFFIAIYNYIRGKK